MNEKQHSFTSHKRHISENPKMSSAKVTRSQTHIPKHTHKMYLHRYSSPTGAEWKLCSDIKFLVLLYFICFTFLFDFGYFVSMRTIYRAIYLPFLVFVSVCVLCAMLGFRPPAVCHTHLVRCKKLTEWKW